MNTDWMRFQQPNKIWKNGFSIMKIDPEYRGKGYGTALLKKLAKIVDDKGYGRFEWTCLSWNQPSIDFYISLGAEQKDWNVFHLTGEELKKLADS